MLSCGCLAYSSYHHVPFIPPELVFLKMVSLFICILFTFPLLSSVGTFSVCAWLGCIVYKFKNCQLFRYWFCFLFSETFLRLPFLLCIIILRSHVYCQNMVAGYLWPLPNTFLTWLAPSLNVLVQPFIVSVLWVLLSQKMLNTGCSETWQVMFISHQACFMTELFMMPSSWKSVWVCLYNIFEFFLTYNCSKTWSCNGQYCFSRA